MFGGNVRDEERRADREPADVASSEEIIFGGALFARKIKADAENENEINNDDGDVHRRERPVRDCDSCCCEEHRASVIRLTANGDRVRCGNCDPDRKRQKPGCENCARRSVYQRMGWLNGAAKGGAARRKIRRRGAEGLRDTEACGW